MDKSLTLGSLFDGSGGFPLGAIITDIKPKWASEIEPFPIRVTTKRLPFLKHVGDITKIKGHEIEPVDIITFGSPCQDMSIAGKRYGLKGNRSVLFYEAIRIVKEMRERTNGQKPRYIVWENVPGAFTSNKGEDFRQVLEEICKVKDEMLPVPKPDKWEQAGKVLGDGFSIAWRVFDAQFWGVPQRRKRIYLVADFDGWGAGKILFESDSLPWDSETGFCPWQDLAKGTGDGSGKSSEILRERIAFENHGQDSRYSKLYHVAPTVLSTYGTGGNNQPLIIDDVVTYDVRLTSLGTRNARNNVYETTTSRTIDTSGNLPDSNQGGIAVIEGNGARPSHKGDGFKESDVMYTLNATEQHAVAFEDTHAPRPANEGTQGSPSQMLASPEENFPGQPAYGIGRPAMNQGYGSAFSFQIEKEKEPTLMAAGPAGVAQAVYSTSKNSHHTKAMEEMAGTLVATDYKDPPIVEKEYIVRRLTPTECARLQGFPDWWCVELETEDPSDDEILFWKETFKTYQEAMGKAPKEKTDKQIRKWLKDPHSDSAEYKMWGNGVALPNVVFVLYAIKNHHENST